MATIENKLNIEISDAGMLYYINNIFASDFIHDYRYGGSGGKRLNKLAKKVEEIRKMIGFSQQSSTSGGKSLTGGRVSVLNQSQLNPEMKPFTQNQYFKGMYNNYNNDKSLQYVELANKPPLPPSSVSLSKSLIKSQNELEPALEQEPALEEKPALEEAGLEPKVETELDQDEEETPQTFVEIEKWQNDLKILTDEFYSKTIDYNLNILIKDGKITEDSFNEYLNYNVLYNQTPFMPYNTDIEGIKIFQYGDSPLSEWDILNAKKVLTRIRGEMEGELKIIGDIDTDSEILAKSFQTLSFQLHEYVSEFILTTIGYIDSNSDMNEQAQTLIGGGKITDSKLSKFRSHPYQRPLPPGQNMPILPPLPPGQNVSILPPTVGFESVLQSLMLKKRDVYSYYNNSIKDIYDTVVSINSKIQIESSLPESERDVSLIQEYNEELNMLNFKNNYLNQEGEIEIAFIDKVIDTYISLYYATISNETFKVLMPTAIPFNSFNVKDFKKFFKIKAELQDIMNNYIDVKLTHTDGTILGFKNRKVLINELTSFVLNFINPPTIDRLGPLMSNERLQSIRGMIKNVFPNIESELLELFPRSSIHNSRQEKNYFVTLFENILFSEQWVPINEINPNLFAVHLLQSSYFEDEVKQIALIYSSIKINIETSIGDIQVTPTDETQNTMFGFLNNLLKSGGAATVQYPTMTINKDNCLIANSIFNSIIMQCSEFLKIGVDQFIIGGDADTTMNEIFKLHDDLFNLFDSTIEVTNFRDKSRIHVETIYNKTREDVRRLSTRRTGVELSLKSLERLNKDISSYYDRLVKKYCSEFLKQDEIERIKQEKDRKIQAEEARRESAGEINKPWASQLVKYAAKASLIITESVKDIGTGDNPSYQINVDLLEILKNELTPLSTDDELLKRNKGHFAFYLSTLYSLIKEANWARDNNNLDILNRYLSELNINGPGLFNGDIDERTIQSSEKILKTLFPTKMIGEDNQVKLNNWKRTGNKTMINNAISNWPGSLSKKNSFCPMSSINDAQPTCSNYTKAKNDKEIEVADINVSFQNPSQSLVYDLQCIVGKTDKDKNNCKIIVKTYIGNGMNEGLGPIPDFLYIQKETNMNSKDDDDKTLSACNVFGNLVQTIKEMWSSMYTSFPDKTPEQISELCWDAMLTKYNYFNFLKCSHLKALGDSTQELNGALKYGGYTSGGIRSYNGTNIYYISNNTSTGITDDGKVEPYDPQGNALRGTLSNDRQAGSRSIWLLTCLPPEVINNKSLGGYSGPNNFVIAVADPVMISSRGGGKNGYKITIKRKYNKKNSKIKVKYTRRKKKSVLKLRYNKNKGTKSTKGKGIQKRRRTRRYKPM